MEIELKVEYPEIIKKKRSTHSNILENVFYRNPNLTRVGSLAARFVNIASIMILR